MRMWYNQNMKDELAQVKHARSEKDYPEIKLEPEKVDVLVLKDVTTYFKSLMLEKNLDIPFITKYIHKNIEYYLLGTFNNDTEEIQNMKLILPVEVALDVKEILGDEKLVVLT